MKKPGAIYFALLMTMLFSCNNSSNGPDSGGLPDTPNASMDSTVRFLLDAAAKDFNDHQPPIPVSFRNVQVRNLIGSNTENHYMLCGEFLSRENQSEDKWTSFATIQTSGYEQWIGNQSLPYCQDAKEISYHTIDLSTALKSRMDSLQNVK